MANYTAPSHSIFNKPGDEGSCPDEEKQAEAHKRELPSPSHDKIQAPGQEGSSGLGVNDTAYQQGATEAPPTGHLGEFQKGPEVRRTKVAPASNANPYEGMPGAK